MVYHSNVYLLFADDTFVVFGAEAIVTAVVSRLTCATVEAEVGTDRTVSDGIAIRPVVVSVRVGQARTDLVANAVRKVVMTIAEACSTAFAFFARESNRAVAVIGFVALLDAYTKVRKTF